MNHKIVVRTIYAYLSLTLSLGSSDDCLEKLYMTLISVNMNVFMPPMLTVT